MAKAFGVVARGGDDELAGRLVADAVHGDELGGDIVEDVLMWRDGRALGWLPGRQRSASVTFFLSVMPASWARIGSGGGVAEAVELVGGGRASLRGPCPDDTQLVDRLDGARASLGRHRGLAVQHRPGGGHGVRRCRACRRRCSQLRRFTSTTPTARAARKRASPAPHDPQPARSTRRIAVISRCARRALDIQPPQDRRRALSGATTCHEVRPMMPSIRRPSTARYTKTAPSAQSP